MLLEAPILLIAMFVDAKFALRSSGVARSGATLFAVGFFSLVLQQCADVAVGVLLRGTSLMDYARQFATAPGMIYAALLIAFGLMPWATQRD